MKTTPLVPTWRTWLRVLWVDMAYAYHRHRELIWFTALVIAALAIVAASRLLPAWSTAARAPTPIIIVATPGLSPLPVTPTPPGLPRGAVAYDQPTELGGRALGALDAGRAYTVLGRYGAAWVQIDAGSGPVWVVAGEAGLVVDAALTDLQPPPTAQVVFVAAETRPQVIYVPAPAPQPLPAEPASEAATVLNARAGEAAARSSGAVFTTSRMEEPRQAGPAQCSNDGRSCLGRKP